MESSAHHGQIIRTAQMGTLTLTEVLYRPRMHLKRHFHEHACLCYVLEGAYTETIGQTDFDCTPLKMLYRPPARDHVDVFRDSHTRCLLIELGARDDLDDEGLGSPSIVQDQSVAQELFRVRTEWGLSDAATPLAIESLVLESLAKIIRQRHKGSSFSVPSWLAHAKLLLDERLTAPMGLSNLASLVGVHPTHLARSFRQQFHLSVGEYIRRRRLDLACEAIRSSSASLAEVAVNCGFCDQAHFCRSFVKRFGATPKEYRRMHKPNKNVPQMQDCF